MGNWTSIIVIPPLRSGEQMLGFCNQFLNEQYTPEHGWNEPCAFASVKMPFTPDILVGEFSYFHLAEFIIYLKKWFNPIPHYVPVDPNEKDTKYVSKMYQQINIRWGTIHLLIRREHDDQFWLLNITEKGAKPFGHLGVKGL